MSTRNPITTVGRSSESLLTNVQEGKGRFLFKEKPEIKNICGLFGTASQPNIKRNPKIEKSDFKEVFIKYYGVNLQASSGGQGGLFTNIRDSSISPSTNGHYMSPKTKKERISLRSIDYNEHGQPVNELFQQLIRDIDQKNDTTDFADDFTNTGKILGGKGVDMTKEDVFGILFVHDGGSEGKTVTGNGIIYHIYRHFIDTVSQKKLVLKKVESHFQVAGNILMIDSGAVTLPVVQGLAKLIGVKELKIEKGPIVRESNGRPEPLLHRHSELDRFDARKAAANVKEVIHPGLEGLDFTRQGAERPSASSLSESSFSESASSSPPPPSATTPIGTVPEQDNWRLDEEDPFATQTPSESSSSSSESSVTSLDTIARDIKQQEKDIQEPLRIEEENTSLDDIEKKNREMMFFKYELEKENSGIKFYEKKRVKPPITFVQGDKTVRDFFVRLDAATKKMGTVISEENQENAAAEIVKEQAKETETVLQNMLADPVFKQASGGEGGFKDAITEVQLVKESVETRIPTVQQAIKYFEGLSGLARSVSSFDDKTIGSEGSTIKTEKLKEMTPRWIQKLRESRKNLGSAERMSSSSDMSELTEYSEDGAQAVMSDDPGSMRSISTEDTEISNLLSAKTASERRDSLATDKLGSSSGSYGSAHTSPPVPTGTSLGGKRKTRRRSSKKNRKSKKVGGKKTKPKRKTKGKKIPFKKLLKKTRAKK